MNRGQQALWDMTRATEPTTNEFKLRPNTASSAHETPSKSMKDLSNAGDGIEVIKISSSGKLQVRFFSISNNNRTVLLSSEKTKGGKVSMFSQSSHRRIDVSALLWVQKGQFTDKFHEAKRNVSHVDQRGKKKNVDRSQGVQPNLLEAEDEELSLSIYYREHDTKGNQLRFTQTLDLIFLSEYDCNLVQMALQEMMHLYHASRLTVEDQDVLLLEQVFLSIGKDIGRKGIGYYYADLSQSWNQDKRLLAKEATEKKKSSQGKVGLTDICNILHNHIQCNVLSKSTIKKLYKSFCTMKTIKPDAGLNLIQLASFFRQIRMKSLKEMSIANPMNIIWNDLQKIFVVKSSYKSQNRPKDSEEQIDTDEGNDDMSALTQDNELDAVNNGDHTGGEEKGKVTTPKGKKHNTADTVNCATFMKFMRLIQKDPDYTLLDTKKTFQNISNQRDVDDMMCGNVGEQYITNIEDATTKDFDEIARDKFFSYLWSDRNDIFDPEKGRDKNA